MTSATPDMLFVLEDPSVTHYSLALFPELQARNIHYDVMACGVAAALLEQAGQLFHLAEDAATAHAIWQQQMPRLLVAGTAENPDTISLRVIDWAKEAGIASVGLVDAAMNAHRRFSGNSDNPKQHAPDHVIVPDAWTKQAFMALGFDASMLQVAHHPHIDALYAAKQDLLAQDHQALRRQLLPDASPEQPVVLFVSENAFPPAIWEDSLETAQHWWPDANAQTNRTELGLVAMLDACKNQLPDAYTVLRLHPRDPLDAFADYHAQVDQVSHGDNPWPWLYAADLVAGMTSMLLTESFILERPTLSLCLHASEKPWLAAVRNEAMPYAEDKAALEKLLKEFTVRQSFAQQQKPETVFPPGIAEVISEQLIAWLPK